MSVIRLVGWRMLVQEVRGMKESLQIGRSFCYVNQ
jgi:hypothetical protein